MYYFLTSAVKDRVIMELRKFWSYHPRYKDSLVQNIVGKYQFSERPLMGAVVKTGSGNPQKLSSDNFVGTVFSYITLARLPETDTVKGMFLEWVKEDTIAIRKNSGRFPSLPGAYYIEITEHDQTSGQGEFFVDPLCDVRDERVQMVTPSEGVLNHEPFRNSLRLYELPSNRKLVQGVDFDIDPDDRKRIVFNEPIDAEFFEISADYRFIGESSGPWSFKENYSNNQAIPGVILAFGRKVSKGDKVVVLVYDRRQPSAFEYGGKWSIPIDIEVFARDHESQMEISDETAMFLHGILPSWLHKQGLELREVSISGESEEVYDEAGDNYIYSANITCTLDTDWSIYYPLDRVLRNFEQRVSPKGEVIQLTGVDPSENLGLEYLKDPFFRDRSRTFETIK